MKFHWLLVVPMMMMACESKEALVATPPQTPEVSEQIDVETLPDYFIQDELIVRLAPEVKPEEILQDFSDIELEYQTAIAPSVGLHLYSYNLDKIEATQVLDKIRAHTSVVQVEFNKELNQRE